MANDSNNLHYVTGLGQELGKVNEHKSEDYLFDFSKEIPPEEYTLKFMGVPTMPKANLIAIKGAAKSGKTHAIMLMIEALLSTKPVFGMESMLEDSEKCIALFDTEQSLSHIKNLRDKIYTSMGWPLEHESPRLKIYPLRELSVADRKEVIKDAISYRKEISVAFIDGVADLVLSINNEEETSSVIDELGKTSSMNNCAICCVLHTNKSDGGNRSYNRNMRGHLGTFLKNKASDIFDVSKDNNKKIFCIKDEESRNSDNSGVVRFKIDEKGNLQYHSIKEESNDTLWETIKAVFDKYPNTQCLKNSVICDELASTLQLSRRTCQSRIKEAKDKEYIKDGGTKGYILNKS